MKQQTQAKLSSFFTRSVPVKPADVVVSVVYPSEEVEKVTVSAESYEQSSAADSAKITLVETQAAAVEASNNDFNENDSNDDEDDGAPSPRGSTVPAGLSEYEKVRLENMRRNAEFLASLGLDSIKPTVTAAPMRIAVKKRKLLPVEEAAPTRRSARVAGGGPTTGKESVYAEHDEAEDEEEEEDEADVSYDDSSVLRYALSGSSRSSSSSSSGPGVSGLSGAVRSLSLRSARPMLSESLAAIYSLHFHPTAPLLMAAGKGGYVSLFRVPPGDGEATNDEDDDELMTFKAHGSWVAAAKFVAAPSSSASASFGDVAPPLPQQLLCVTASNDGSVKVRPLTSLSSHYLVHTTVTPHPHA